MHAYNVWVYLYRLPLIQFVVYVHQTGASLWSVAHVYHVILCLRPISLFVGQGVWKATVLFAAKDESYWQGGAKL